MRHKVLTVIVGMLAYAAASLAAAPAELNQWASRLQKFGSAMQQEQIFIHMDNTCYFLGDTIYFKAYVRKSDGTPTKLSSVLYAELLNQDGYLVKRQLLEMKDGQVHGSFELQDTLYGGYYELRAYTRWQLNWGEYQHDHVKYGQQWFFNQKMAHDYYRDYEKLYSRVFPVYDKPKNPGEYEHEMTLRPLRRQFKADGAPLDGSIQLFPEGGHLIAGVPNRIAFEANNEEGMHLEGKVAVVDGSGAKVAEASTELRGRGTLEFTPKAGAKYTAQLTWKQGSAKQALPEVEENGVALKVTQKDGKVELALEAGGEAATQALGMTVMNQGILQDFRELGSGTKHAVTLSTDSLKTGVCQVTVFNEEGRIYADRLFFVRNGELKAQSLTFTGISNTAANPFEPVTFDVHGGKASSTVSLAVRDAEHCEYLYDNGNILTEMLLGSQIRGFVENPGFFFEADDDVHQRALDLLLMVQGWRRYNWHDMATPNAFVLSHMPERTPLLTGEVNNYTATQAEDEFKKVLDGGISSDQKSPDPLATYRETEGPKEENNTDDSDSSNDANTSSVSKNPTRTSYARDRFNAKESPLKREVLVHAFFSKKGAESVQGDVTTNKAQFSIQSPRFFDGCILQLAASDSTKWSSLEKEKGYNWRESGITSKGDINYPEFYVKLNPFYPRFVKPYTWYQCNLAEAPKGSAIAPDWLNDGSRTLAQVTIGASKNRFTKFNASKPAFVVDAYEALNEISDAGLCTGYYIGHERFAQDIARTYIGDMNMHQEYDVELRFNTVLQHYKTARQLIKEQTGLTPMPTESSNISNRDIEKFNKLTNIDKVYIYTDYSPRREGDKHYTGADQPVVTIDLRTYPNEAKREVLRDRIYVLPGFSSPEDFYQPNYSTKPLPVVKDYRRTLYWNPDLKLDDTGSANVTFYNNGKQTHIAVSAEGMATDGSLMTGKNMPEDR